MSQFDYGIVKNPEIFAVSRMNAHSDHVYYGSKEALEIRENEFRYNLNGFWKFHYAKNYANTVKGFEQEDYDCRAWDDIRVPAHIQLEGYDKPQYVDSQYPWDGREEKKPGEIPERFNPVASYVKYFHVPEQMRGRRLFISFQGAESGLALWMNGKFVGYSEDTFTPSEFELTDYVKEGENKLAVQVFKWTSGSWCEDQDFYRFSGIFRDVYLFTIPDIHIWDMDVRTLLDDAYENAVVTVDLKASACGCVKLTLKKQNDIFYEEELALKEDSHFEISVKQPELWSAETPVLYDLLLEVFGKEGEKGEVILHKVGFRRFELKDGIMQLNGKRIVFKGVNRHEFSSVTGRYVSEDELRKDLMTMKQHNINAIRTCHYPDASLIYQLCDEYGFYLIDEANLESHGLWNDSGRHEKKIEEIVPGDRPEWHDMMIDRVNSMYQRDKNHPCILIWSCGNESFGGRNIFDMSQFLREHDPNRLVHYEGVMYDRRYNDTSDIESQMYIPVARIKEYLANDRSKPFISCEYTHAMGNSCGAMHKYTDLTEEEPLYQGGFIWDYIDQTLYKKDRYGKEFQAYGGDFGDRPTNYRFSANGIVYGGERDISPKMQEVKFNYQNISAKVEKEQVTVINKNLFVNTNTFDCIVTVQRNGREIKRYSMETDTAPLSEKTYTLPAALESRPGEYVITVSFLLKEDTLWAKKGHEVAFGQGVYTVAEEEKKCTCPVEVIDGDFNIGVRGETFDVLFSVLDGGLVSYRYGGVEMIEAIPKPNFWRAPVDNDYGNHMPIRYAQWKIASLYLSHRDYLQKKSYKPRLEEKENSAVITFTYVLPTMPTATCDLSYEVFGDGRIKTTLSYVPVKELGDMPEFGVIFKFDADYEYVEWYGNGPAETYEDRKHGAKLGIYKNKVCDNMAKYIVPQECGNKTGVRYAKVTNRKGRGILFTSDEMNFSALPYTPHELENAAHPFELPEVHYTVVRVSKMQMGIAGDNSWGYPTHPEYCIPTDKKLEFTFSFQGI